MIDMSALIGKPMLWKTENYGSVAVHIAGISPNGMVATVTIVGGEASTPAQRFPELSDGIGFATFGQLSKRPGTRKKAVNAAMEAAEEASNDRVWQAATKVVPAKRQPRGRAGMIRAQAEIGKRPAAKIVEVSF